MSEATQEVAFEIAINERKSDQLDYIWKVSRMIRKEILTRRKWSYTGTFADCYIIIIIIIINKYLYRIKGISRYMYIYTIKTAINTVLFKN